MASVSPGPELHDDSRFGSNWFLPTKTGLLFAIVPVLGVLCFLGGFAASFLEPTPTLAVDEVVAMKPIEGEESAPVFTKIPIETLHGVPSERTVHLWSPQAGK